MRILVACDSFKNALDAPAVCHALAEGLKAGCPQAVVKELPLADGGEGTADALIAATGARIVSRTVTGPRGRPVTARAGILPDGRIAVMDMASCSGIQLLEKGELDPFCASTRGAGELFLSLVREGVGHIIIGLGGSATVDGGSGFLSAIGASLRDSSGAEIAEGPRGLLALNSIDISGLAGFRSALRVSIASDVTNPLLGSTGAAAVFGPQKGARPEDIPELERCLESLAAIVVKHGLAKDCAVPGDGAAGGLGFALRAFFPAAAVESGAALVMRTAGFHEMLDGIDVVITGEGKTDSQTTGGKLCSVVAEECASRGIPVILVSGALEDRDESLPGTYCAVFSIAQGPCSLEEAIGDTAKNCRRTGRSIGRLLGLQPR